MTSFVVGTELGPVRVTPSRETLVRYAAASQDFAPLHYDQGYAESRGFDTVLVHGMLKAGYLGSLVRDWAGEGARIHTFSVRYLRPDYPDSPLMCRGIVTGTDAVDDGVLVRIELWVENVQGQRTVAGTATVWFEERETT
jgi:acyl dehydratase